MDIEVELAWGVIDQKMDKGGLRNAALKVREHLDGILHLLEQYSIPVTWGIVGHLVLDKCESVGGVPHPEMPHPSYKRMMNDRYKNDPCETLAEEPAFYGKDIVDKIVEYCLKTQGSHDIACHSFSHQLFGVPGCSEMVAEAEVRCCLNLLKKNYGVQPRVFIFPRDSVGHLNVLRKQGFVAFRGPISHVVDYSQTDEGILGSLRKDVSLAVYLASFYLTIPPPVVDLKIEDGLINIPASLCYNKKPFIPLGLVVYKAKKGIDRAVKKKKIFHLYTHLINFGAAPQVEAFIDGFKNILAHADLKRQEGRLDITTLQMLAETASFQRLRIENNTRKDRPMVKVRSVSDQGVSHE